MRDKFLVITCDKDATVDYIIKKYKKISFFRLNTDKIGSYTIGINNRSSAWEIVNQYGETLCEADTCSIYYRKPLLPKLEQYEPNFRNFMQREIVTLIEGLVESFPGTCITKPSILRRADNKVYQLSIAKELGFNLPDSLITNSNQLAEKFCNGKESIVKPLSIGKLYDGDKTLIFQTNKVKRELSFTNLEFCPSYFQKYQEKDFEVRLTIVGDHLFPVKLDTQIREETRIDWRVDPEVIGYSVIDIPEKVKTLCLKLLSKLGLQFGAFDFIVKDDMYTFLELNANGQWGWLEDKLDLDISLAIVNLLSGDIKCKF